MKRQTDLTREQMSEFVSETCKQGHADTELRTQISQMPEDDRYGKKKKLIENCVRVSESGRPHFLPCSKLQLQIVKAPYSYPGLAR
jgi:hypothetical protein